MTDTNRAFDLAVIGAGIVGALAGHLATVREPGLRVLTVDQGGPNASGFSAGLDVPTGRDARQRRLAARSRDLYQKLLAEHPALPVRPVDTLWLIERCGYNRLRETMAGPRLGEADPDVLAGVFPGLRPSGDRMVLRSDGSHHADVGGLARSLLARQRDLAGCAVWDDVRVTALDPHAGGYHLLGHRGQRLARCREAIIATGPWAPVGPFGDRIRAAGLRIKKVAAFYLDERPPENAPVLIFEDDDAFLLPETRSGRWLFSFTCREWDGSPLSGPPALGAADRSEATRVLRRYLPAFPGVGADGLAFYDGYTHDRLPLVEPVPGHPGVVLAVGGNGSGYRLAPATAEQALGLLTRQAAGGER
ncbi:FAD-binding oxidoreductase [Sphaerisporangium sp. TRM90804]|uniref:NAD(P)/FAD-dependent oxidoreductase n=1 Tax=Sphaerisporangium sp. TRM90804 TaxID=3031113 RepID=UPI00244C2C99|nr:FAD-binding oxidoreductase [Sphaerisporangium sp. TRM90804]MDH2425011.1 FAD-binding oxidoreductase [Sphaerisporangium sp. TRM90804]